MTIKPLRFIFVIGFLAIGMYFTAAFTGNDGFAYVGYALTGLIWVIMGVVLWKNRP